MTDVEKNRKADKIRYEHGLFATYLGAPVVAQEVVVRPHPLEPDITALQVVQPFKNMEFIRLNWSLEMVPWLGNKLASWRQTHPNILDEIQTVIGASRELQLRHQLGFDLIGDDNYGFDRESGAFTIVDASPIPPEEPYVLEVLTDHYVKIESALALAR